MSAYGGSLKNLKDLKDHKARKGVSLGYVGRIKTSRTFRSLRTSTASGASIGSATCGLLTEHPMANGIYAMAAPPSSTVSPRLNLENNTEGASGDLPDQSMLTLCNLPKPPWRQHRGKSMVSSVNCHTNATINGWHLWEIDLKFAPGLPAGWSGVAASWGRGRSLDPARPCLHPKENLLITRPA